MDGESTQSVADSDVFDSEPVVEKIAGPSVDDTFIDRIVERLSKALGRKEPENNYTSFKVVGRHFFATWSNNFMDREGEMFTAKAIDQYVARVDAGLVPKPELWVWHLGAKTRIGAAGMVARHGHFSVAAGTFDDTWQGKAAQKYYAKHQKDTAFSHGFTYNPRTFDGKHYGDFNSFELTTLPRGPEANRYTTLDGVKEKEMAVTEEKKKYLVDVFGKDGAEKILSDLSEAGKALEDIGVEFKDFGHVNEDEPDTASGDKATNSLIADLIGGQAEGLRAVLDVGKAFKAYKADQDAKYDALKKDFDKIREDFDARPRSASKDDATALTPERIKAIEAATTEQLTTKDPFWLTDVPAKN